MKKALFITHMLNRTGAPLVLMQMMDVFSRNSYNVDVISMEDGVLREDLEARGITVDVIDHPTQHQEEFKKRLKGYDIVVCNTLLTVFFILIMQGEKVPVLWWIHEGRTYFEMYKKILSLYAAKSENIRILSVSPIVHNLIKEYLGIDSDIVPFAAPENEILPDSSHMWQNDKLKLIMTGQLSFLKGQDIFIDALNLLPEQMAEKMQIIMCLGANENDAEVVSKVNAASEKYHNITVIDSVPHDEMLSYIFCRFSAGKFQIRVYADSRCRGLDGWHSCYTLRCLWNRLLRRSRYEEAYLQSLRQQSTFRFTYKMLSDRRK